MGAGGHASVVANVAWRAGFDRVTVWYETLPDKIRFANGTEFAPATDLPTDEPVVLAMGDLDSREHWRERHPRLGPAVIDPSAVVGHGVGIASGVVLMPGVIVNPNAWIHEDAILNTGCIVEHDCSVGRNTHVAPGARLGGAAVVGSGALIGTGAIVLPGRQVGDGAIVGAGAVVTGDVPAGMRVKGIPAREVAR